MREGGSKAVWNFSENSSDLVAWPFPNVYIVIPKCKYKPKSIIEIVASPLWMHHVIATAIITARARVEERCWRGRELEVLSVTAGLAPFPRQPRQFQPVSHPTCFSSKLALGLFSYRLFIFCSVNWPSFLLPVLNIFQPLISMILVPGCPASSAIAAIIWVTSVDESVQLWHCWKASK